MNTMNYQGFRARLNYSDEDCCFVGRVSGIEDVVGFHGDSVAALRVAFKEAVDDYLKTCSRLKKGLSQRVRG